MDAVEAMEFGLLGYVEAVVHGVPVDLGHSRQRCVFAVLLAEANRPVSVTQLLDRVWADRHPQRPRAALSGYLSRLRALFAGLPDITFTRVPEGYRVTVDPDRVDLHRYRRLVAEAHSTDDAAVTVRLLNEALRAWRGEAFATLDTPWFVAARKELEADRFAATLDRNDAALDLGRHADLLGEFCWPTGTHWTSGSPDNSCWRCTAAVARPMRCTTSTGSAFDWPTNWGPTPGRICARSTSRSYEPIQHWSRPKPMPCDRPAMPSSCHDSFRRHRRRSSVEHRSWPIWTPPSPDRSGCTMVTSFRRC
jgi:DNA-binding winged helix-turn-helix (wHTH) protein